MRERERSGRERFFTRRGKLRFEALGVLLTRRETISKCISDWMDPVPPGEHLAPLPNGNQARTRWGNGRGKRPPAPIRAAGSGLSAPRRVRIDETAEQCLHHSFRSTGSEFGCGPINRTPPRTCHVTRLREEGERVTSCFAYSRLASSPSSAKVKRTKLAGQSRMLIEAGPSGTDFRPEETRQALREGNRCVTGPGFRVALVFRTRAPIDGSAGAVYRKTRPSAIDQSRIDRGEGRRFTTAVLFAQSGRGSSRKPGRKRRRSKS